MEREVVKNLAVDAKLFLHLSLLRLGTFRHRNFCIVRKATVQIWVTLRSQEGSHEKSVSYPERCPFSKFNRTFHRCSGQLSACRRSWLGKLPRRRWCAAATTDSTASEAWRCTNCRRSATAATYSTTSEEPRCTDCGWRPTAASHPTTSKARFGFDGRWCPPATADSATPEADARLKAPGFGCIAELRSFQSVYLFYCEYWGSG